MQRQHLQTVELNLDFPVIDLRFLAPDLGHQIGPILHQRPDRMRERCLNHRRELQKLLPEVLHIAHKMATQGHPFGCVPTARSAFDRRHRALASHCVLGNLDTRP